MFTSDILWRVKQSLPALVIDDDPQVRSFVATVLQSDGWSVCEAENAEQAFEKLSGQRWALVFCDVILGGADGYDVLRRFTEEQTDARFVLMTGYGSAAGALDATATGAYDYLVKPFSVDDVLGLARSVRRQIQMPLQAQETIPAPASDFYRSDIPLIGRSRKFVECLKMVGRVAATNLPVLIAGESGTGKEVVARSIHKRSPRASGAFVAVNCGAIPVELIESELVGHARGAFTGAERERAGLWEEAHGGTIFLDEITETSSLFQIKLLRALQEGEIRRVGSNRTIKVDVRVIAATNRDIEEEVRQGRFRKDLMYRLNAITIELPPLRERVDDIALLAEHFAAQTRPGRTQPSFSPAALEALKAYEWSGNIRELENAVLHAVSLSDDVIYPEHLPVRVRRSGQSAFSTAANSSAETAAQDEEWLTLAEMEARYVKKVLAHTGGNKQAAARLLGIDRKTLIRIIRRAEVDIKDKHR